MYIPFNYGLTSIIFMGQKQTRWIYYCLNTLLSDSKLAYIFMKIGKELSIFVHMRNIALENCLKTNIALSFDSC